jgi:hypothetical protein
MYFHNCLWWDFKFLLTNDNDNGEEEEDDDDGRSTLSTDTKLVNWKPTFGRWCLT